MEIFALGFIFGLMVGILAMGLFIFYVGKRAEKEFKEKLDKVISADQKNESIRKRLTEVREMTEQQLDMQSRAEGPQSNALHGKFKNGLTRDIKSLEEKKMEILKSIIDDGFDPVVKTINREGEIETVKLSEFMGRNAVVKSSEKPVKPPNKFIVFPGGKGDPNGTTH